LYNPQIRAICLTGSGQKSFCSGIDIKRAESDYSSFVNSFALYAHLLQQMLEYPKPILIRINGNAMGGGLGLILASDISIAHDGVMLGTPEVTIGLFPMIISPLLLQHLPRKLAIRLMLCGESIHAQEAFSYGMISECVPINQLDTCTEQCLQKLTSAAPLAQELGKQAIRETLTPSFSDMLPRLTHLLHNLLQSTDAKEGISAFCQKRQPNWNNKNTNH
jgi:enoyl-CoA hydratase/carnithine racemase